MIADAACDAPFAMIGWAFAHPALNGPASRSPILPPSLASGLVIQSGEQERQALDHHEPGRDLGEPGDERAADVAVEQRRDRAQELGDQADVLRQRRAERRRDFPYGLA